MHFVVARAAAIGAAAALCLVFLGCSGGSNASCNSGGADGGQCVPGATPTYTSCADLTSPTVSFALEVQPVFVNSCAIGGSTGTCHGDPTLDERTTGQVFLGYPADAGVTADGATILANLVGKPSPENPKMSIVAGGDPGASYMMHKLDDDQCQFARTCDSTGNSTFALCGSGMPYLSATGLLDPATRDTIRRWIAQGAKDN